jgi:hypothetical protein
MTSIMKARANKRGTETKVEGDLLWNNGDPIIVVQVNREYIGTTDVKWGKHWHIESPAYKVDTTTIEYKIGDDWLSEEEIAKHSRGYKHFKQRYLYMIQQEEKLKKKIAQLEEKITRRYEPK